MEVEADPSQVNRDKILTHLVNNDEIIFKNQQRGEADLTKEEKLQIAADIFERNKLTFLTRFGRYLNPEHLDYFKNFESEDVKIILRELLIEHSERANRLLVRNRRYEALSRLKQESTYFSEVEMMKRNPLLYDQLVGQYLSEDEKRERDKVSTEEASFVRILMEGIERDESEAKRVKQAEEEEEGDDEDEVVDSKHIATVEEEEEAERAAYPVWGEINPTRPKTKKFQNASLITAAERNLLREEFVTTMYENFLEGKDSDFDYKKVDNNLQYDNIEILGNDAQEKYFDSESPADVEMEETIKEESEDELDTYMQHVHHKLEMSQLSRDLKKL